MCDDTCRERILDGEHYVCPISGYSSARLVTEWEEASAAAKAEDALDEGFAVGVPSITSLWCRG